MTIDPDDFTFDGDAVVHGGSGTRFRLHSQDELGNLRLMVQLGPRHAEFDEQEMVQTAGALLLQRRGGQ